MAVLNRLLWALNPPKQYDEPKDWPQRKKNIVVFTIAYCAFTSPLATSIYIPATKEMQQDLDTTPIYISATVSVYILVIGILPVFWASLCDYMGRRPIYIISMTIALFGSVGCALANSIHVFFVMRTLQGLGTSSVIAVGGGTLSDVFHPGERGTAFGFFYLGPLVGPMIGPMVGGLLADAAGWRSTMWFMFACGVAAWLLVLFVLPETFRQRVDGKVVGPPCVVTSDALKTESPSLSASSVIEELTLDRPPSPSNSEAERTVTEKAPMVHRPAAVDIFAIEGREPIEPLEAQPPPLEPAAPMPPPASSKPKVFNPFRPLVCLKHRINVLAIGFNALGLGGQICLMNTLPITFHDLYHLSQAKIGLSMMSTGFGLTIGSVLGGRYSDFVLRRWLLRQELRLAQEDHAREAGMDQGGDETLQQQQQQQADQSSPTNSRSKGAELLPAAKKKKDDHEVIKVQSKVTVATRAPPEIRLRSCWIGSIILPLGFLIYGWSTQFNVPIAVPLLGCFLIGFGMMLVMASTATVLVDANADNNMAVAAVSCSSCVRGFVGALGGILSLPMLDAMGNGWLYTFWAAIAVVGVAGIVIVILRAEAWRQQKRKKAMDREVEMSTK